MRYDTGRRLYVVGYRAAPFVKGAASLAILIAMSMSLLSMDAEAIRDLPRLPIPWLVHGLAWFLLIFSVTGAALLVRLLFAGTVSLEIGPKGISSPMRGFIPWRDIADVSVDVNAKPPVLTFSLRNARLYPPRLIPAPLRSLFWAKPNRFTLPTIWLRAEPHALMMAIAQARSGALSGPQRTNRPAPGRQRPVFGRQG